jgi:hypothetical protein
MKDSVCSSTPFFTFKSCFYLILLTTPSRQVFDALNRLPALDQVEQRRFSAVSIVITIVIFNMNKLAVYCRSLRMNRSASGVWDGTATDRIFSVTACNQIRIRAPRHFQI